MKQKTKKGIKKKLIITGAAGEVGLNLLELITPNTDTNTDTNKNNSFMDKYDVIAIDKNIHNLKILKKLFPAVEILHADLAVFGKWENNFRGAYAVIQLQAQISSPKEDPYINNNIKSVENVLKVCEKYRIKRLIHASSSVVISVAKDHYTNTKRFGEDLVKQSKIPHIILRPTLMYGCFDIKHLGYLTRFIDKSCIFPMPGSGKYLRQPLFVEDFCNIIINSIEKRMDNKVYNISGREKIYLIDLLKIIASEKKKRTLFITIPLPIFYMLIRIYGFFNRKTRIVPDQLTALTAGDMFPVIAWDKIFHVKPTKFSTGVRKMLNSPHYKYTYDMERLTE